jgi:hypothetical protein
LVALKFIIILKFIMKTLYTEEDPVCALGSVATGVSMRKATVDYRIPRSTLQDRMKCHTSHHKGAIGLQNLVPIQEKQLREFVLVQESLGPGLAYI